MSPAAPSADWYPDPSDAERERWWSGEAWTEHVRARAVAPAAPAVQPALDGPAFSAAVDPEVANRYRVATTATPSSLAPESAPGRPLADTGFPGHVSPAPWAGGPPSQTILSEPNKIATQALVSGALAVGFAIFNTFSGFIATGALITGAIALVQGIVGAVRSGRLGNGRPQAIGAIVAGALAVLIVVGSFAGAVFSAAATPHYDVAALEQEIITESAELGLSLSSSECPDDPPTAEGTFFTCTALGTDGTAYTITVTNDSAGYYSWVIR